MLGKPPQVTEEGSHRAACLHFSADYPEEALPKLVPTQKKDGEHPVGRTNRRRRTTIHEVANLQPWRPERRKSMLPKILSRAEQTNPRATWWRAGAATNMDSDRAVS